MSETLPAPVDDGWNTVHWRLALAVGETRPALKFVKDATGSKSGSYNQWSTPLYGT